MGVSLPWFSTHLGKVLIETITQLQSKGNQTLIKSFDFFTGVVRQRVTRTGIS